MTADDDLHRLVDRLTPAQAAAVRAVIVQFVAGEELSIDPSGPAGRRLAIAGKVQGSPDLAARADEIIRVRFRRS
jgi:hypothetical protein